MTPPAITIIINHTKNPNISFDLEATIKKICLLKGIQEGYLEFNFISNPEIKDINIKHLNHNYETDIITFNLSEKGELNGDIYISVDEALKNAEEYKTTYENEIKLLIVHGILHLLNYNDDTEKNKTIMRHEEKRVMNLIND